MSKDANVVPGGVVENHPVDSRSLLVAVLLVVIASAVTVRTVAAMLVLFGFVLLWHLMVLARPAFTLHTLWRILPFAGLIIVLNALLVPGEPLVVIAGVRVGSQLGARDGAFFALRLGVMLMAVSLLVSGTRAEALARGVHDLVQPVSSRAAARIAFFTFVSLGFVPMFAEEIRRVQTAQSFRSGGLRRGMLRRAGSLRTWLIPVLMSAVRRSGQLALAVELRDIRSRLIPSMPRPRTRATDVVWLVAAIVITVAASWYR